LLGPDDLFGRLETAWPRANAQGFQEGDIKLGVDAAVVVSAGRGDTAVPLEHTQVLRANAQLLGYLRYTNSVVHQGPQ
jgi:hypothetical protein